MESFLRAFGFGVYYPDDPHTRTPGVWIDIPVHATVEGLHTGCDEILEKALEMVRTGEYDPAADSHAMKMKKRGRRRPNRKSER